MTAERAVFGSAANDFVDLVRTIPHQRWGDPGLGEWTVRDLIGHASRSLITVYTYLSTPAQREDIVDATNYYVTVASISAEMGAQAIVDRGRQAGRDLGADPAGTVAALASRAVAAVAAVEDDPLIEVIGGHGIRLSSYLPTRTFELAVHGLDIARAVGIDHTPPAAVLAETAALAARIGVALGQGPAVVLALTGRADLPTGFSVV
ncbi:maleylpyruvate isomerase family mycothiol-dependent enzyme [Mycobacterium sp. SMC-4]|uniref:maleylpyruvate isomerase family mycothiol-dependent enzyme n=1 Tax=Mycobacterium sp. SMC-4 TaxID=2857059 RepID=UPI0021B1F757|nr:maleylpyruvate isomerase family mycothiol-dependent enzyme [Mycobacterium sp. SMC-4]UXA17331.1 maleylpyruvate isomerase family mycothiol-dependent enzyme [Mycobacterium sp. SMC-4]